VAVIVLLLLVGGAGAGWYWYDNYGPGSFVAVPSVAGKAQGEAEAAIAHADLLANVTEEWNDTVPEGQVIRSDPEASVKIRPGGPVNLVISQGVRYETVPDGIEGAAAADAEQILLNAQLDGKIDQSETFHDDVAEGLVISISPGSGEEVRHDTDFTMLVSLGREPVRVPRLDGLTVKQARSAVENAGLEFKQTGESYSESVPEGEILSQDPQPGPGQFRGDQVSVTVSKGREPILIPEVADLPVDEARDILGRAGFEVDVQSVTPPETAPLNRAVATDPPGGEYGYLGDRITLTVV
jgi:serine/threonine-protein kinase